MRWMHIDLRTMVIMALAVQGVAWAGDGRGYDAARWDPRHFKPLIDRTTDAECLQCHAEVLAPSTRKTSPAGMRADRVLAWYQLTDTYRGEQDTFHRRHILSEFAKQVMNLRCNTCHQGHDPRDETPGSSATAQAGGYTLRKLVDPKVCLMCHGQFNWQVMGMPGPWSDYGTLFGNSCHTCHDAIRTHRHQVNYLKPKTIEDLGRQNAEVCYGCHGGRAWYRLSHPYPRNPWEGMDKEVPDWAKDRPTRSDPRFLPEARRGAPAGGSPFTLQTRRATPGRQAHLLAKANAR